ncbi:MAG: ribosome maturation factor RimM [Actinomycetospora chiangmaiensis]|nr:ribosome maturation factor RimM [Actinomycetospora chiangmaiensis]
MARRPGSHAHGDGARRTGRLDPAAVTSARRAPPPKPLSPDPDLVLLGEFGRPHGLNGEIRLKSYTGDPLAIAGYGPLRASDGRSLELLDARPAPGAAADILLCRVKGVADRTGAEALNRVSLSIARDKLGEPEEDEFFLADLIGLAVVDEAGAQLGSVVAVPNYGGGDLLEIRSVQGGPTALLPFTKAFVPSLDVVSGRVTALLPEDFFAPPGQKPADEPA